MGRGSDPTGGSAGSGNVESGGGVGSAETDAQRGYGYGNVSPIGGVYSGGWGGDVEAEAQRAAEAGYSGGTGGGSAGISGGPSREGTGIDWGWNTKAALKGAWGGFMAAGPVGGVIGAGIGGVVGGSTAAPGAPGAPGPGAGAGGGAEPYDTSTLGPPTPTPSPAIDTTALDAAAAAYDHEMTPLEREMAVISGEQYNRWFDVFKPFEEKVMEDVRTTGRYLPQIQGAINANLMQKMSGRGEYAKRYGGQASRAGEVMPQGAIALARGQIAGEEALAAEGVAMKQNIVELGRGGADFATSALGTAAGISTRDAISDWNYQFGLERLDTLQRAGEYEMASTERAMTDQYLSSLFASGAGLAMYGQENDWFNWGADNG